MDLGLVFLGVLGAAKDLDKLEEDCPPLGNGVGAGHRGLEVRVERVVRGEMSLQKGPQEEKKSLHILRMVSGGKFFHPLKNIFLQQGNTR